MPPQRQGQHLGLEEEQDISRVVIAAREKPCRLCLSADVQGSLGHSQLLFKIFQNIACLGTVHKCDDSHIYSLLKQIPNLMGHISLYIPPISSLHIQHHLLSIFMKYLTFICLFYFFLLLYYLPYGVRGSDGPDIYLALYEPFLNQYFLNEL